MNRTLSGVLLIGLAVLVVYLWARGSITRGIDEFSGFAKSRRKPRLLGGQEAAGA